MREVHAGFVRVILLCCLFIGAQVHADTGNTESTLVKILSKEDPPQNPNQFDPDDDGIVDRAHFRLLDKILATPTAPHFAEISAACNANHSQVKDDNDLGSQCTLLEILLGLTCNDFEIYGAGQITIAEPAGNERMLRLLDSLGITVDLDDYDLSARQWLAAGGDLDGDGFTNAEEFDSVCGDFNAFVEAAMDSAINPDTIFCCGDCPLTITTFPMGARRYTGEAHAFEVAVSNAEAPLHYQWLKGNIPVGADSNSLTFSALLPSDSGDYRCEITDGTDTVVTPSVNLLVADHLMITEQPAGTRDYTGNSHTFSVAAAGGLGSVAYQWDHDGGPVGGDAPTLSIGALDPADSGVYTVTLSDESEMLQSDGATLEVADHLLITGPPQDATVVLGSQHTFSVTVSGGLGTRRFAWSKGGVPAGGNSPNLTINAAAMTDAGEYRCVVSDDFESVTSSVAALRVVDALTIQTQPVSATKVTGTSHAFQIETAGGAGTVRYDWFKNGVSLGVDAPVLDLAGLVEDDAGTYWCVVSDVSDSVESDRVTLTVVPPLAITASPQNASRLIDDSHTFSVAVSGGFGERHYQWFKDGDPVGEDAASLVAGPLTLSDAGTYQVTVTDDSGSVQSATAELAVAQNLLILEQPQGGAAYTGESFAFSISVSGGIGTLHYAWTRDGNPVGTDAPALELSVLTLQDAGVYRCTVRDDEGAVTSATATLAVADHLTITLQPEGAVRRLGESHTLQVTVTGGLPPVNFVWRRDGVPVGTNSATLTLEGLRFEDAGQYVCEVTDRFESRQTTPVEVVVVAPLTIDTPPLGGSVKVGSAYTFRVALSGGFGTRHYQWRHDGNPVGTDAPELALNPVGLADAGAYTCEVSDALDTVVSEAAQLLVFPPIQITRQPRGAAVLAGDSHRFEVAATGGDGPLQYRWFKDGEALDAIGSQLEIPAASLADAGEYFCVVSDQSEELESAHAALSVAPRLHIVTQPMDAEIARGASHTFRVAVEGGLPPYHYAWYLDGLPVGDDAPALQIDAANALHDGRYRCRVRGTVDTLDSDVATLRVTAAPRGALALEPPAGSILDFGFVHLGNEAARQFLLRNDGNAVMTVTFGLDGTPFYADVPGLLDIAPGEEHRFTLRFIPDDVTVATGVLNLSANGATKALLLRGTGLNKGLLGCAPATGAPGQTWIGDLLLLAMLAAALGLSRRRIA